jgi:hypothetical protein
MAEILIRADNRVPGAIVAIQQDGYAWAKKERPPFFYLIKLPQVAVDDVKFLHQSHRVSGMSFSGIPILNRSDKYSYSFDINNLSDSLQSKIVSSGFIDIGPGRDVGRNTFESQVFNLITQTSGINI